MENTDKLNCPECGASIDVNSILYQQIRNKTQEEFDKKEQKFDEEKKQFLEEKDKIIEEKLKSEKSEIEKKLRKKLEDENTEQIKLLEKEVKEKSEKVKKHNKLIAENEKLKRDKEEMKTEIEANAERELNAKLKEEKEKYHKQIDEKYQFKFSEQDKVIDGLKNQLTEAQRKAEQGLTQRQGEVQELAIEQYLKDQFPLDLIEEVKKGSKGADCLQTINTQDIQNCGTIYYESKRTKNFQETWIEKFKNDIREKGANIGVLVTEALPKDMERFGQRSEIWICTFNEFKGLCFVLRNSLINVHTAMLSQKNKGGKMEMLYNYLTSNEFKLQIEGIFEGFIQMETALASEKRAMESIWKTREKQIKKVLLNTNHLYSSIKGIAGNAIPHIKQLELSTDEEK